MLFKISTGLYSVLENIDKCSNNGHTGLVLVMSTFMTFRMTFWQVAFISGQMSQHTHTLLLMTTPLMNSVLSTHNSWNQNQILPTKKQKKTPFLHIAIIPTSDIASPHLHSGLAGCHSGSQTPQSLVLSCSFLVRVRAVERQATDMWKDSCQTFLSPNRKPLHTMMRVRRVKALSLFREEWNK